MIKNINILQRLAYTGSEEDLQSYSDIYLKQSLANLGQRFSIRGDGVTNGSFNLYELIPTLPIPAEDSFDEGGDLYAAYMVGYVQKDLNDDVTITLSAYKDDNECIGSVTLSAEDYVILDEGIYSYGAKVQSAHNLDIIAFYDKDSMISSPDGKTLKAAVRSLSYNEDLLDISFNNYDEEHGRLNDAVRAIEYEGKTLLTFLSYDNISENKVVNYTIYEYEVNDNSVDGLWGTLMSPDGPVMEGDNKYDWTGKSIVDALDGCLTYLVSYSATWNGITRNLECDCTDDVIKNNVMQWNESCDIELPLFRSLYNENVYFSTGDNLQLKKRIVAKVFLELYNNYVNESQEPSARYQGFPIIAPYEYEFIYTCNSINPGQIYSASRSITEESTAEPFKELWKIRKTGNQGVREQLFICKSCDTSDSAEDIYSIWNYYVTYDKDDIVNDITVIKMYVMPYINDDGYWNINNTDTSIYARGKDGGQPSIIISYSDLEDGYGKPHILSSLHDYELENVLSWEVTEYQARPLDTSTSIGTGSYHMMRTYMPTNISAGYIAENLVTFLENAIIMDVASVRNEDFSRSTTVRPFSDQSELGENATVTTFWAIRKDEETKQYYFSYVKQPSTNWAVDFNYLTDAEAIVRYYMQLGMEPDKYRHSWLVYDEVNEELKNQVKPGLIGRTFPVLMNRLARDVSDVFDSISETASDDDYLNNLNFVLGFYNNVKFSGSYITGIENENDYKFFGFDSYNQVDVVRAWRNPAAKEYSYDYYPNRVNSYSNVDSYNSLIPTLELKETFVRNLNVLNRYNILSADENGYMYYSYFGETYESPDKSVLHIGTSNENINLGLMTLTKDDDRKKFKTQHEIDVDFATIVLNGDVVIPKAVWVKMEQQGHPENVMYSTLYELAYIFASLPEPVDNLEDYADDNMVVVYEKVSNDINDIGNNVSVSGKTTNVSYVNLNWLFNDILRLDGDSLSVTGNPGSIYEIVHDDSISYFLKLTTDILNEAELAYAKDNAYYVKTNPLSISYAQSDDGIVHINIREDVTTHSTAYLMYDGGELQYED